MSNGKIMKKTRIPSIREIREKLSPLFDDKTLQVALLFGSAASGKRHAKSDIDVAFLFDRPVDVVALANDVIRLLSTDNIDVVDLRRASPLLKFAVAEKGLLLYEREKGLFNEFYSLAFRRYVDTKKLRDARVSAIKQFLQARGLS